MHKIITPLALLSAVLVGSIVRGQPGPAPENAGRADDPLGVRLQPIPDRLVVLTFDDGSTASPAVYQDDACFSGPGTVSVALNWGQPLRDWAGTNRWAVYSNNPVLGPGAKGEWDAGALGSMTLLQVGAMFHLYYEAWGVRGQSAADYNTLQIGHATSSDGLHWAKDPANPVLPQGAGNAWDRDGTWDPFVLYEDGVFKMWYGGGMDRHCDWGYAVSTDGVHFVKQGQLSHLGNVEDDHVVHDQATGRYFMYYWDRKHEPMSPRTRTASAINRGTSED